MLTVIEKFTPYIDIVRQSAIAAGFSTWEPASAEVGSGKYAGMSFVGAHATMNYALMKHLGRVIIPNLMFFRLTLPDTEPGYVHSDREAGQFSAIVYLSEHKERFGTAFYRHKDSGLTEMPSFDELRKDPVFFEKLKVDMVHGGEDAWEETTYVGGAYNRAVVFSSPLFHQRIPSGGCGSGPEDGRLIFACHFFTDMSHQEIT